MKTRIQVTLTESELLDAVIEWLKQKDDSRCPDDNATTSTVDIRVKGIADGLTVEVRQPDTTFSWEEDA